MPRAGRKKSHTHVYHVILRGNNREGIFEKDEDKKKFLQILKITKKKYGYALYAYVIMDNHVHLLIDFKEADISVIMQSIAVRYARYFNEQYERVGHVFENRYKSYVVETLSYLKDVLRYIHYNCQKAKMASYNSYPWSSYIEYLAEKSYLVDTDFILRIFDVNKEKARKYFEIYHSFQRQDREENSEIKEKMKKAKLVSDEEARKIIEKRVGKEKIESILIYNATSRKQLLQKLKNEELPYTQIARILGIHRKTVERAMKA